MCTSDISFIISALSIAIAVFSLLVSIWQYKIHKRQLKTELFSKYCTRYSINSDICAVVKYLEKEEGLNVTDKNNVSKPNDHQVEMFMRFFEELELLIRSDSLDEEIVSYMFYYYLQTFSRLKENWKNIEYDSENWKIFHQFMDRMKRIKEDKTNYKIS